uniref:Elicitin n=1 Tax=Globisporangium ultimum (strain ATCC 200006 / CBS 805.95 / DAOM BR144) TaxID=431595 RepID=K3WVA9_GLOUD
MKFSIVAVAATFAVANAVDCDLMKVRPLLTNANVATCTTDSGFSFVPPTKPTADTMTKICASAACKNVLAAVEALGLGDCALLGLQLETDLLKPIQAACSGSSTDTTTATAGSTAGSSAGNSSTGATVGSTTTSGSTTAESSASSADADTVDTPAATKTPTPSPTSGASSAVIATGAAVMAAIAASFL